MISQVPTFGCRLAAQAAPWLLLADRFSGVRGFALVLGIASFCGGVLLLLGHKRRLDHVQAETAEPYVQRFEQRKFRRRALVGSLIASMGAMLAGLYWVTDVRVFVSFILMILGLLISILGIALIDLFSVSLQTMAHSEAEDPQALLKEYQKRKQPKSLPCESDQELR